MRRTLQLVKDIGCGLFYNLQVRSTFYTSDAPSKIERDRTN
ncbi:MULTISPECIES: hypothetical protein [unclassified Microcoleus]|nr:MULTISPECIES: hypothetical protein [unclassified Microcoleus]